MTDNATDTHRPASDEVDLIELAQYLWSEKLLFVLVTFFVTVAAGTYAFLATPKYEVRSILRPATLDQLGQINRTGLITITSEEALQRVGVALQSYENRLAWFRANPDRFAKLFKDASDPEQAFELFSADAFKFLKPEGKEKPDPVANFVGLALTYPGGFDGVKALNEFVDYAHRVEKEKLLTELQSLIANRLVQLEWDIQAARAGYGTNKDSRIATLLEADNLKRAQLQDELNALRKQLKQRRQNRIAQLEEAIHIASALGIVKPTTPSQLGDGQQSPEASTVVRAEVTNQAVPLYFMGTETLEAERDALRQRTSDDFAEPRIDEIQKELRLLANNRQVETLRAREDEDRFIENLDKLQGEMAKLRGMMSITPEQFSLARLDRLATEPRYAVAPKKRIIVGAAVIAGGLLGLLLALFKRFAGAVAMRPEKKQA